VGRLAKRFGSVQAGHDTHVAKMESRRALTRRLPCVGSRVGGLGYDHRASETC
jgi:hypothetical protein